MVNLTTKPSRYSSAKILDIWGQITLRKTEAKKTPLSNPVFSMTYVLGPSTLLSNGSFSLIFLLLAMHLQKHFFIVLHFNSRWTLAFLTSPLYIQALSLNSSLFPPSVHFIFHLCSEVAFILSMLASAVLTWLSEDQSALLCSFVLHPPECKFLFNFNHNKKWPKTFSFHYNCRNKITIIQCFLCCYLSVSPDIYRDC